jgi:arylsulfatase
VLPLNNEPARFADRRFRRERYELYPGIGPLPEAVAPNLRGRGFTMTAELDVPASGPLDGTIVAHGSHSGGYALYHDGWKSVVFHPTPFIAYDGTDVSKPFDDDVWELYHVAADFSEVDDLAEKEPEQLEKMKDLWWEEAAKYQVLPLNNEPARFADRRFRRERYELYPGIGPLPEAVAPNLRGRGYVLAAALDVPVDGEVQGTIVAHGSHSGGYALYLQDRRLHFAYNYVGTDITVVSAGVDLPEGEVETRLVMTAAGEVSLFYGDAPLGEGAIPRRTPITYGMIGFTVGYQPGGSICPALSGRAEVTPGVLRKVVIEPEGRPRRDPDRELRKDLATQ